ncbi:MAG: 23S rRNA (adenine(2503)-C(2))-methyltransferase [Clostridiales bacterium GWF2_38_85]|nr:MAG: 23S rRNA (adenine(2503)-C(2))-methyltransferase [Clostridiales bacterium GWF2_38_85]HBL84021.1 23S rRNA (adenine(2503)-C(2))-methyltransferase RlmN [Clostridiales bacterium]
MFDIKSATINEIKEFMTSIGESAYRAEQIFVWLSRGADFDEMTNIPVALRNKLKEKCYLPKVEIERKLISKIDETIKYLFKFSDGEMVETVLLSYKHGNSICLSTQVGCRMGCSFCASTMNGLSRNLTASEILEQITATERDSGCDVQSIVLMGIGEPLDNYDNVLKFLHLVNDKNGLNIGMRHISLSTCGLVDKIKMLAKENLQITLSISLHAPNDKIRSLIMPIAKKYSIDELFTACREYTETTGRRISYEYAMIAGVNDSPECARELGRRLFGTLTHVNLIPLNPVEEKSYNKSDKNVISDFTKVLEEYKIRVTVRRRLGSDINASCGQLRNKQLVK